MNMMIMMIPSLDTVYTKRPELENQLLWNNADWYDWLRGFPNLLAAMDPLWIMPGALTAFRLISYW